MIKNNDHLKITLRTKDLISFYKNAESLLQAIVKRKLFICFLNKVIIIIAISEKMCFKIFSLGI